MCLYVHKHLQIIQSYKSNQVSTRKKAIRTVVAILKPKFLQSKQDFLLPDADHCLSGSSMHFSRPEALKWGFVVSFDTLWIHFLPSWLSDAFSTRLYQCLILVFSIISSNACRPSITLRTPNTACKQETGEMLT